MKKQIPLLLTLLLLGVAHRVQAQYYGVGVNLPLLASGTINVSFEGAIAPSWSVDIPFYWNPINTKKLQLKVLAIQPGVRYWFFEEYAGHFTAAHITLAQYDIGNQRFYRKGSLVGLGLCYGYSWLLSSR